MTQRVRSSVGEWRSCMCLSVCIEISVAHGVCTMCGEQVAKYLMVHASRNSRRKQKHRGPRSAHHVSMLRSQFMAARTRAAGVPDRYHKAHTMHQNMSDTPKPDPRVTLGVTPRPPHGCPWEA